MPPIPLLTRVTSLIVWLAVRIAGAARASQAEDSQTADSQAALEPRQISALLARLRHLAAQLRAVAGTPIPPPKPARLRPLAPAEPKFVPTRSFHVPPTDPPPDRGALPRAWRWLLWLVPQATAARAQLEELLRDPSMQENLAADPRLGPLLRPLGWMLGVHRALLPAARRRRRPVILVPGGRSRAAAAAAEYAAARAKAAPGMDVLALCCMTAPGGRDRRPIWCGFAGPALPDAQNFPA